MSMDQIIIALSGTSGTGKTTLAQELSKKYDLAIKSENIRPIIDALKIVAQNKDPNLQHQLVSNYIQISNDWIQESQEFIKKHDRCVLDRCALDILTRFFFSNLFNDNSEPIFKLTQLFRKQSESMTALIIPSIIQPNISASNEDKLVRHPISRRLHSQACTIGLAKMYARCPVILLPHQMTQLEPRTTAVSKAIEEILNRSHS
jgi:predicted ATPase